MTTVTTLKASMSSNEAVSRPAAGRPQDLALTPALASHSPCRESTESPARGTYLPPLVVRSCTTPMLAVSVRSSSNDVALYTPVWSTLELRSSSPAPTAQGPTLTYARTVRASSATARTAQTPFGDIAPGRRLRPSRLGPLTVGGCVPEVPVQSPPEPPLTGRHGPHQGPDLHFHLSPRAESNR